MKRQVYLYQNNTKLAIKPVQAGAKAPASTVMDRFIEQNFPTLAFLREKDEWGVHATCVECDLRLFAGNPMREKV